MSNPLSTIHSVSTPKRPDSLIEAQTLIRQQAYDLKLLTNDNQLKTQQIEMLREKVRELEESANGYQNQVTELEENLNLSNQEFKAKWQAEQAQSSKLAKNNKALLRTNQQLQQYVKELEQRQATLQEALQEILGEVQGLKQRSTKAQQAVLDSKELVGQRQKELEMADATIVRSRIENEELKKELARINEDNSELDERLQNTEKAVKKARNESEDLQKRVLVVSERNSGLEKELEAKRRELEEYSDVKEKYESLKGFNERDKNELGNVKHGYEVLKRKYEDLQHEHESKMIAFEQVEAQIKLQTTNIEALERQLEKFKTLAEQKEEENTQLGRKINELEKAGKNREASQDMRLKEILRLIDNQVVDDIEEDIEDADTKALMMSIVRLNRNISEMGEKLMVSEEEYKYLEKEMLRLTREKEDLVGKNEELARECDRLAELEEAAQRDREEIQVKFDVELEKITNILHENERHLDNAMQGKENDIQMLLEERDKLGELLETQEAGAKEMKAKFLALAEEASIHKGRLERISYVLGAMLKVFVNLLIKFKALGKHKDFLGKYFWMYRTLKQSLDDKVIGGGEENKEHTAIVKKFKRAVLVVKTIVRLRKLKRKGRDTNVDEYEVMSSLDNMPEELRRFICELFKYDRLGIEKSLIQDIQDSISSFDGLNENSIIGGIISKVGLLRNPEVNSILSEWSSRGFSRANSDGYDREYASRSPYGSAKRTIENSGSGGKLREYRKRLDDMPRQVSYKRRNEDFIKEFDSLKEDSGHWTSQNKVDELSELDIDGDNPPLNERVNKHSYGNTLNYRRDEYKLQKAQEQRLKTGGSNKSSVWEGPQQSLDEYSTPGFNSPGEGHLSERKGASRKYDSLGL